MKIRELIAWCEPICACDEALEWLRTLSPDADASEAWATCPRGDWMFWLCGAAFGAYTPAMRIAAVAVVREVVLPRINASRGVCERALIVVERYARGDATDVERRVARDTLWFTTGSATRASESRAVSAAYFVAASDAAGNAASDAAGNAASAVATAVAWGLGRAAMDAAWFAAINHIAIVVRAHIAWPEVEEAMNRKVTP